MAKINILKEMADIDQPLLNAIRASVESKIALNTNKKNKNGLFSPFLFGEFLFWQGKALPKINKVVDTINHFNALGGAEWQGKTLFIFIIPYDDKNKDPQNLRVYLTTENLKFSVVKEPTKKSAPTDKSRLVSRLEKITKDFTKILSDKDKKILIEMIENYKK